MVKYKIKGLANDHPVQKEFNEYMQKRKEGRCKGSKSFKHLKVVEIYYKGKKEKVFEG